MISSAAYIPRFLVSFFAGVWADRYSRKRLIIAADGAITVATMALVLILPQISRNEAVYVALMVISAIRSLGTGIRYAAKERFLGKLIVLFGLFIFLCVPAGFLATLYVSRYYGDTYFHMNLVEVFEFLGMMAGGLLLSNWGGFKRHTKTLLVGMMAFGLLVILVGWAKNFYVYLALMVVCGIALTMVQTASTTLLQENSEPEMAGRIFGLFGVAYSSFLSIGMVIFGLLADRTSMRSLMVGSGALRILMAAVCAALCLVL